MATKIEMKNWGGITEKLETSGMMKEDINAAGKLGDAIHTLDKLAFPQNPLPFVFHPSESIEPNPGGYISPKDKLVEKPYREYYFVNVGGLSQDLLRFENELKRSWPLAISWAVNQNLCLYSLAAEIVRLRVQEQLPIELFSPAHAGKITKIPILNQFIEANILISERTPLTPERFDAHVMGSYTAQMLAEGKRDGLAEDYLVKIIAELVKLDAQKVR
jgi:hypothetical protein